MKTQNSVFSSVDTPARPARAKHETQASKEENRTRSSEMAVGGGGVGSVIGGALGWIVGISFLSIPETSPIIAAAPIWAMLGLAALGAIVGGIAGSLIGMQFVYPAEPSEVGFYGFDD